MSLRGLDFEVPEFPRLNAAQDGVLTLPPPELGQHTLEVLQSAGIAPQACEALVAAGAVKGARSDQFQWAALRAAV